MGADLIKIAYRVVPLGHSAHTRVCNMWLENSGPQEMMLDTPNSEKAREPPIIGMESRLGGELKSFPLLFRLSRARLTSVRISVKMQRNCNPNGCLGLSLATVEKTAPQSQHGNEGQIARAHTFYLIVEGSGIVVLQGGTRPCMSMSIFP